MTPQIIRLIIAAIIIVTTMCAPFTRADQCPWTGNSTYSNSFSEPDNWYTFTVPGEYDSALFDTATYPVTQTDVFFHEYCAVDQFIFKNGDFAFDLNIQFVDLNYLYIGLESADNALLSITNGDSYIYNNAVIGRDTGSTGQLDINDNTDICIWSDLTVSQSGNATLNINSGGGIFVDGNTNLGSLGTININGGTFETYTITGNGALNWNAGTFCLYWSDLYVSPGGLFGDNLTITPDKTLVADNIIITTGSSLTLDGGTLDTSSITNLGSLTFNSGSLELATNLYISPTGLLGDNLTLTADKHLWLFADLTISADSFLSLTGGTLQTQTLTNLGSFSWTTGTLSFTDSGLTLSQNELLGQNLTLQTDKILKLAHTLKINPDASLQLTGGTLNVSDITNLGSFSFSAGTLQLATSLTIAPNELLTDNLTLTTDKILILDGSLTIDNAASVNLAGGSLKTTAVTNLGSFTFSAGSLQLTNSALDISPTGLFGDNLTLSTDKHLTTSGDITIDTASSLTVSGGSILTNAITNRGYFELTDGYVQVWLDYFNNADSGTVLITNGHLATQVGIINHGSFTMLNGTASAWNIINHGSFTLDGGTIQAVNLQIKPNASFNFTSGTLNLTNLNIDSLGSLTVSNDSLNPDNIQIQGSLTIDLPAINIYSHIDNQNTITITPSSHAAFHNTYTGYGQITGLGSVTFLDNVTPGTFGEPSTNPATINIQPDVTLASTTTVNFEIAGTELDQFDRILIAGSLNLAGTFNIQFINNFSPSLGDSFQLITCNSLTDALDNIIIDILDPNLSFSLAYNHDNILLAITTAPTIPGDYNHDLTVDQADFTTWADSFSNRGINLPADGNSDGIIDQADFTTWADNFGNIATQSPSFTPEPATITLLTLTTIALLRHRCRATS